MFVSWLLSSVTEFNSYKSKALYIYECCITQCLIYPFLICIYWVKMVNITTLRQIVSSLCVLHFTSYISPGSGDRRGITVSATSSRHLFLSSVLLRLSLNTFPVHSVMLSSHLLLCLPLFLFPCTVPGSPDELVTCPYHFVLDMVNWKRCRCLLMNKYRIVI